MQATTAKDTSGDTDTGIKSAVSGVFDSLLAPRGFALALAVLLIGSYGAVLFSSASLFQRDFLLFGYPLAQYHKACFWAGELPLWNPLNHCGVPFLAQWNTLVLYPGSLIYLLFPLPWSLNVFVVAHTYLAGSGMYLLARHLTRSDRAAVVAGVAYAFSGLLQEALLWPNNSAAFAWLPVVLWAVDRACREGGRWWVIGALTGGVQMLAGAPEVILVTWLLAAIVVLPAGRAGGGEAGRGLRFGLIGMWVAALAAVQLVPFLELLGASSRAASSGTVHWAASILGWVNLFVPSFETAKESYGACFQTSQGWVRSFYPGLATMWWGAYALHRRADVRVWPLCLTGLLCLALAPGENSVLYRSLDAVLPLGFMRYPVKFLIALTPILPLLAAFGVAETEPGRARSRRRPWIGVTCLFVLAVVVATRSEAKPDIGAAYLLRPVVLFVVVAGLGGLIVAGRRPAWSGGWSVMLLLVLWFDLRWHLPKLVQFVEREALEVTIPEDRGLPRPTAADFFRAGLSHQARNALAFRHWPDPAEDVVMRRMHLAENLNLSAGSAKTGGFFSLWFFRQEEVAARLFTDADTVNEGVGDFLGLRYVKTFRTALQWRVRPSAMPLVTIGQRPLFRDGPAVLEGLLDESFDPRKTVYLPTASESAVRAEAVVGATVSNLLVRPHEISFQARTPKDALAVIAQGHYAPWRCRVDGAAVEIYRANKAFQAVVIPAGEHEVRLTYEDSGFRLGAVISGLALLAGLVVWFRSGWGGGGTEGRVGA